MVVQGISMNKRIIIIETVIIIFCVSSYVFKLWCLLILASILFAIVTISLLLDKSNMKSKWNKELDFLNDDRRNYDIINIGYNVVDNEGLDLTVKHSNIYSDYLLLQRYYSLGKRGCKIKFNMKNSRFYFDNSKTLSLFVLNLLHDVTVLEHGTGYYLYKIKWGCFFNTLLYFLLNICDCVQVKTLRNIEANNLLFVEINRFAVDRGFEIDWYINGKKLEF